MLSLLRWFPFRHVPLWGLFFLLAGMTGPVPQAAEPVSDDPESTAPTPEATETVALTIDEIERLGRQMRESTPALLELITSSEASLELRRRAVLALAAVGPEDIGQARVLFDLLGDVSAELELRRTILMAFGENDLFAPLLVPALVSIVDEPRNEPMLRRQALFALGRFPNADAITTALARVVARSTEDAELRLAILNHLRRSDQHPEAIVDTLVALVRQPEPSEDLRKAAIAALRSMGPAARPAAPALVEVLTEADNPEPIRMEAWLALVQTGWPDDTSSILVGEVFDPETPSALRVSMAGVLARMETASRPSPTVWLAALEDPTTPKAVRQLAAGMLARADLGLPDGVELSGRLLRDANEDPAVRAHAAEFLRRLGVRAAPARATLETVLLNTNAPLELRETASTALAQVAQAWLDQPDQLDRASLNQRIASLDHTLQIMDQTGLRSPPHPQNLEAVRRVRDILRAEKESRWFGRLGDWAEAHPVAARWLGALALVVVVFLWVWLAWWTLARMAPLKLGRLQEALRPYEFALPGWLGGRRFGLRQLSLLCCWSRDERVTGAWVSYLKPGAVDFLAQLRRSRDADTLLEVPVEVDGKMHSNVPLDFTVASLAKPGARLVITGAAGTGKTCLALRIATHACATSNAISGRDFIPVWVDATGAAGDLVATVRDQLHAVSRPTAPPSTSLIRDLLRLGRIALVFDGISEWAAADRDRVLAAWTELGRPSVLTTTREAISDRPSTRLRLPRLNGAAATGFIGAFLERAGAHAADADIMQAGRCWLDVVAGRAMPVDTVRLYAEYLLATRAGVSSDRPENLFDLVRRLIERRNARTLDRIPDDVVRLQAGQLAWACVQHGGSVGSDAIPEPLKPALAYFEQQLRLIRSNPKTGRVAFISRTAADLLAAGHLIDTCGRDSEAWKRLRNAPSPRLSGDEAIARLGEAIWHACYRSSDPFAPVPIPDGFHAILEREITRAGPDGGGAHPRARQLVRFLLAPENSDRTRAIKALAALGPDAGPVISQLLDELGDANQDLEIRHAVLAALTLLGRDAADAKAALSRVLLDRQEHLFLRVKAIDTLASIAPEDPATAKLLVDRAGDPAEIGLLRTKAGEAAANLERSGVAGHAPATVGAA
jgi:hypothetical protein